MKQTMRNKTFETNSSSTHSLVLKKYADDNYTSASNKIVVDFIDTDSMYRASSLKEKVSYLVSQIINNYKYDVLDYKDLKEQIENDYNFKRIKEYVKEHFNKEVVLPNEFDNYNEDEDYEKSIDEIVNINHQLINHDFDELLKDIVISYNRDFLGEILNPNTEIEFGHD